MTSPAAERWSAWVADSVPAAPLVRFRVAFGAVWLLYDLLDLSCEGTARIHDWLGTGSPRGLIGLQLGLILCESVMVFGKPGGLAAPATLMAAVLRGLEWHAYLTLNDFAYFAVTALILSQADVRGGLLSTGAKDATTARWPRDVLVLQAAWIYFATALMKLNPSWLSGRHLYVRLEYLHQVLGWPYPALMTRCAESLPCDAALAAGGVLGELTLALVLAFYPRRKVALPLVVMIHTFGALGTNVWFFGPSLIAQVAFLTD